MYNIDGLERRRVMNRDGVDDKGIVCFVYVFIYIYMYFYLYMYKLLFGFLFV